MTTPGQPSESVSRYFKPVRGTRLSSLPVGATLQQRVLALEEEASKLSLLLEMSQFLSSEKELDAVMGSIVDHTTRIMNCERSSVLLMDQQKNELYALVAQGLDVKELRFSADAGIAGHVVKHGVGLNVPDAYKDERFNQAVDKATGFHTVSILCMPLHNRRGEALGVIQCLNKKDSSGQPVTFTPQDEIVLSAVAAQAAVYLDNAILRHKMDVLFEAFVEATARSIDERDPCTSGHSRRVMLYALNLARAVHETKLPPLAGVSYTRERLRQLRYAALLHDVGKIGVREHILCKAARLAPASLEVVRQRLVALRERSRADALTSTPANADTLTEHASRCGELDAAMLLIEKVNAALFLPDPEADALKALLGKDWLTEDEFTHLSVRRGNLTDAEWIDMRSHVEKTYRILHRIPWPPELQAVAEIAYSHHEKRDGSGYPRKLKQDEIHLDGQILCIADIYDALTASDRPYKKAIPHDRTRQILIEEEAARGKIIPELVQLFFDAQCYNITQASNQIGALAQNPL
ncbi:MAG TPA: HD domain-containing phosphohydrolase [Planctomycetota bacterium]|jgi:HD-GYP domain-containing protein (c-di-GMP phosphodiesterase class II)